MNHVHFEMNAENWKENIYVVKIMEDIDNFLKLRDREFEETE